MEPFVIVIGAAIVTLLVFGVVDFIEKNKNKY